MRRLALPLLLSMLALAPLAAQRRTTGPAHSHVTPPASSVQDLQQIERDIGTANIRRDKAYFDRVEATEFLFTGSNGSVTTKAEDLASLDEPPPASTLESYDVDSMTVRIYGTTAVVWGRVTMSGKNGDGTPYRGRTRFTDTFVWRDGRWQLVAGHSSRIPSPRP